MAAMIVKSDQEVTLIMAFPSGVADLSPLHQLSSCFSPSICTGDL